MSSLAGMRYLVNGLIDDYQRPRTNLSPGEGEYHLRTLLKVAEWAHAQQPFQPGDKVNISARRVYEIRRDSGWYPFRDAMRDGPHEVVSIEFNGAHERWTANVSIAGRLFGLPMSWLMAASATEVAP